MTPRDDDLALAARLHRYLLREQSASADDLADCWSQPLAVRLEEGDAIAIDAVLGWADEGGLLRLTVRHNRARFRRGDELHLGGGDDPGSGPVVVFDHHDPLLELLTVGLPAYGADRNAVQAAVRRGPPWVLDRAAIDTTVHVVRALQRTFGEQDRRAERVRDLLSGRITIGSDPTALAAAVRAVARLAERGVRLGPAQEAAFTQAFSRRPLHLIQGPPGTGKTWLLALLAAAWAWRGERLLLTAFTHTAVDRALAQLAATAQRFGAPLPLFRWRGRDTNPVEGVVSAQRLDELPERGGMICGATLLACQRLGAARRWHRVVFDEAAQIPVPHALCALDAAPSWVAFGDDQQLGPVTAARHDSAALAPSLFAHLRTLAPPTVLEETWRLNDALCRFPSAAFYAGRLRPAAPVAARRLELAISPSPFASLLAAEPPAVWVRLHHRGCQAHAPEEVALASALAASALRDGLAPDELAVISPFRRQNREIARTLAVALGPAARLPLIDTVERIQGQERDVVILSLTCSDPAALRRSEAFYFSAQRLNVAITRARRKLVVLASDALLEALPATLEGLVQVDLFLRLLHSLPQRPPPSIKATMAPETLVIRAGRRGATDRSGDSGRADHLDGGSSLS